MNQIMIGKFIAKCRKEKNLTQVQLAEKLNITDRAVSKWETGKNMPDLSIMLELCEILGITVNELLNGEKMNMEEFEKKADENSINLKSKNEDNMKENIVVTVLPENRAESECVISRGKIDYFILFAVVSLVLFGIMMIFSASYYFFSESYYSAENEWNNIFYYLKRQSFWAIVGFAVMMFITLIDSKNFKRFSFILYLLSLFFLVIVLIPQIGIQVNGARCWLHFGLISFQPSEAAKLGLILYLPNYIVSNKGILNLWHGFLKCCAIVLVPAVLIGIENISASIVVCVIGFSIIFTAMPRFIYFMISVVDFVFGVCSMVLGKGFHSERIQVWFNSFEYPKTTGLQMLQSLLTMILGGLLGLGLSRQKLGFISMNNDDIVFTIICERLDTVGIIILVILFAVLIWRGCMTVIKAADFYMCYVASGIMTMITLQVIMNISVISNTVPNVGIPLPFISYGGTALVIMMSSVGVLMNISRYFHE